MQLKNSTAGFHTLAATSLSASGIAVLLDRIQEQAGRSISEADEPTFLTRTATSPLSRLRAAFCQAVRLLAAFLTANLQLFDIVQGEDTLHAQTSPVAASAGSAACVWLVALPSCS